MVQEIWIKISADFLNSVPDGDPASIAIANYAGIWIRLRVKELRRDKGDEVVSEVCSMTTTLHQIRDCEAILDLM